MRRICAEKIRGTAGVSAVLMNVERLRPLSEVRAGELFEKKRKE